MTRKSLDDERPDRLYTVTGGRSRPSEDTLDLVTLIVSRSEPAPGMQSEHVEILRMCRRPMAVVEISSYLGLPVSVVKILLCDLLGQDRISARHPSSARGGGPRRASGQATGRPDATFLKKVLVGLQNL
ncbi:MAG TPA: DUF742 domain-containing protein [Amycolatopsis sp.]|uniref:DUF742 domain-containing protein n=1 Tax=Amycolatopsis sp. TaxID=37632 RepID=UPI002B459F0F|nr:DUF742 domain-containing protein [Amycolatopsis sp.]HKS45668.1 DUF742 domain-containing protein [Amycolatopsis sp.]